MDWKDYIGHHNILSCLLHTHKKKKKKKFLVNIIRTVSRSHVTRRFLQKYLPPWKRTGQTLQKESCASMHTGQTDTCTASSLALEWTTQNLTH